MGSAGRAPWRALWRPHSSSTYPQEVGHARQRNYDVREDAARGHWRA